MNPRLCAICSSDDWIELPGFSYNKTVTTSGFIVDKLFGKAQCRICGLVQRIIEDYCGASDFYENHYEKYYDRPGTTQYDVERYKLITKLICESIKPFNPASIIDVGCGSGLLMKEMAHCFPEANIQGVDPSVRNSENARKTGLQVITSKIEDNAETLGKFDLVYAVNVIQHSLSPTKFLENLQSLVSKNGLIVIVCPDATNPNSEIMYVDQNYSFCPSHLLKLGEKIGLSVHGWHKLPETSGLLDRQLVVFSKKQDHTENSFIAQHKFELNIAANVLKRKTYLDNWFKLDDIILQRSVPYKRLFHFGASMWTYLIQTYCPRYWKAIECCVVDNESGFFMGKKLLKYDKSIFDPNDVMLLGVNPMTQPSLSERFKQCGLNIITWHDVLHR